MKHGNDSAYQPKASNKPLKHPPRPRRRSEWVSVEDRLPPFKKPVLVTLEDPLPDAMRVYIGYLLDKYCDHVDNYSGVGEYCREYDGHGEHWLSEGWYTLAYREEGMAHVTSEVTHWMPLPEAAEDTE